MGDRVAAAIPDSARAGVALPGARSEVRQLPTRAARPGEGWLRVASSGICGTDVNLYKRGLAAATVLGHHVAGTIAAVDADPGKRRWSGAVGERVVVEEYLPCGTCRACVSGAYRLCPDTDLWGGGRRIGTIPVGEAPGLYGGNAEYLLLPPNAVLHPLPGGLPDELAAWVLPYANALDWTVRAGGVTKGDTVVVLGPGYHGLAVTAAARWAGADVIVAGLSRDRARLAMAERLGALPVTADSGDELATSLRRALGSEAADVVVDTVGPAPHVIAVAVELLGQGGRLVLTTPKSPAHVPIDTTAMTRRNLTVTAVRGRRPEAIATAISSLAEGTSRLQHVPSADTTLDGTGAMLDRLAEGTGPETPHVVVRPHAD
ncbi:zinc-binding dehydrogenase [Streptomyces sp. NPDC053542]|uniref:zinc-binding dehydrogenase n=1 Tax=Streptomyces sp. NPDC053542 TaxID=3365710 RepID=UPI0037D131F9